MDTAVFRDDLHHDTVPVNGWMSLVVVYFFFVVTYRGVAQKVQLGVISGKLALHLNFPGVTCSAGMFRRVISDVSSSAIY